MQNKEDEFQTHIRAKHYGPSGKMPVLIYCDPGIDDAIMLAHALTSPHFEILGIICSAGNTDIEQTLSNALCICEMAGRTDLNVFPGARGPLSAEANSTSSLDGKHVYGEGGLGKKKLPPPKMKPAEGNAIHFAAETIINSGQQITIVSTAGLTDVYLTLDEIEKKNAQSLKKIAAVSMMGGVFNIKTHANAPLFATTRWAEFNIIYDAKASKGFFKLCANYDIRVYMSPLDLTHQVRFSSKEVQLLRSLPQHPLISLVCDLLDDVPTWYLDRFGRENPSQPAHDLNATMCLLHPELYKGKWVRIKCRNTDQENPGLITIKDPTVEKNLNVFVLEIPQDNTPKFFSCYADDITSSLLPPQSNPNKHGRHSKSSDQDSSPKPHF